MSSMDTIQKQENWLSDLQKILFSEGALKIGFGDLTDLPEEPRMGMPRGISIAVPLDLAVVNKLGAGMTHAYPAEYNRTNALLNKLALLTADFLQRQGFDAIPMISEAAKVSYKEHASV